MLLDWLVPTVMRLEAFFANFTGNSHQRAAIQLLQEEMPPELLKPDAEWFQIWKAGGKIVPFGVPYLHQLDLEGGEYKCFTAAMAMIAKNHGVIESLKQYDDLRSQYGDTIEVMTHIKALQSLDLTPEFVQNGTIDLIEAEIDAGRPIGVGWLHRGDITRGEPPMGIGHWSVIIGYTENFFIVHDPMGEHDLKTGLLRSEKGGNAVHYPKEDFLFRWEVEGPGTGWAMLVDPFSPIMTFEN